jgi:PAS domain S-box-containing protein
MRQPVRGLFSSGADGVLLRWLLPGSTCVLLGLAWLIGLGHQRKAVVLGEGTALMLFGGLVLLFVLIMAASGAVGQQEARAEVSAAALRDRERLSRSILDTALDGVVLMNSAGEIVDWNSAAERIFGWTRKEMMGKPLVGHVIPNGIPAYFSEEAEDERNIVEGGKGLGRRLELQALRRDGRPFSVELSLSRVTGPGSPMAVAFVRDITERKAAEAALTGAKEAAEKANRAKDDFLAALSHELRTPLTPVLLSASTLAEDRRLPEDVRNELVMIKRNIALEARLIDDLLDLTRVAKGKLHLRMGACDAHQLLGHAVEMIREEAESKGLLLEMDLRAKRSGVTSDPARLQQVFWNLLKNAVKFTPANGRIWVLSRDGAEDEGLIFEVSDTGVGFATDAADGLFVPFEQGAWIGNHQFGGLGLGLAIARAIVKLHGGTIEAHSAGPGMGARFTVRLPLAFVPPEGSYALDDGDDDEPLSAPLNSLRILLVEDHEPTRKILARLLERAGNEVYPAGSVTEAVAAMKVDGFDVVVSDLGLPDGSGLDLMPQLRLHSPRLRGIALSGYGMEEDLRRSSEAGFAVHLVKPVKFDQLTQALRQVTVNAGEG